MQERRRTDVQVSRAPTGEKVTVPDHYWYDLKKKDIKTLCQDAGARPFPPNGVVLAALGETLLVDREDRCIKRLEDEHWERVDYPILELLCLVYLLNVAPGAVSNKMISVPELKDAHFFQGPHALRLEGLLERYGRDLIGFKRAAEKLGGEHQDLADAAYRIPVFPKVPLYYLLWEGDEEFPPRVSILFDSTIEKHLKADAIWGLVNLTTRALLRTMKVKKKANDAK